jgi:voltage-gated potassium channel Kch
MRAWWRCTSYWNVLVLDIGEARVGRGRFVGVVTDDGLLILMVAFCAVAFTVFARGVLPDLWLAVTAGKTTAESGLPTADTLTVWGHGLVDQQLRKPRLVRRR